MPAGARHLLCASTIIANALLFALPVNSAAAAPLNATDLGAVDAATPVEATLWLDTHETGALDAAVEQRITSGSPLYHRWMQPADVAALRATPEDVATLTAQLQAAGLTIVERENDNSAITVSAPASTMQRAFGTSLHTYSRNGARFTATTTEPVFAGSAASLIAGITGLSDESAEPLVRPQTDLSTGRPKTPIPANLLNPYTKFTDDCFRPQASLKLAHFEPNGQTEHAIYRGPKYTTRNMAESGKDCGYTPAQVAAHYGLPAVYSKGTTGAGQTIVIVDAYGSPTIRREARIFSKRLGLPELTTDTLKIVYPNGKSATSPYTTSWPLEISLDVEWAHAMAPAANIVLVIARDDKLANLAKALHYAVENNLGEIISNSYGIQEAGSGVAIARSFDTIIKQAAAQGIAVNAATGDTGDFGLGTPVGAASIPADSPFGTGIGGTSLAVPSDNGYVDTAWGTYATALGGLNGVAVPPTPGGFQNGGGGGESSVFKKPHWQSALTGTGRLLPDVSAIADPFTGGIVISPNSDGSASVALTVGGTSLSSPVFSGIWALADQAANGRLGQAAPIISRMPSAALTDIVPIQATISNLEGTVAQGSFKEHLNPVKLLGLQRIQPTGFVGVIGIFGLDNSYDIGYGADSSLMAAPGWDNATGYGEPNGLAFIQAAAAAKQ